MGFRGHAEKIIHHWRIADFFYLMTHNQSSELQKLLLTKAKTNEQLPKIQQSPREVKLHRINHEYDNILHAYKSNLKAIRFWHFKLWPNGCYANIVM